MWDLIVSVSDHCLSFYFLLLEMFRNIAINTKVWSLWRELVPTFWINKRVGHSQVKIFIFQQ